MEQPLTVLHLLDLISKKEYRFIKKSVVLGKYIDVDLINPMFLAVIFGDSDNDPFEVCMFIRSSYKFHLVVDSMISLYICYLESYGTDDESLIKYMVQNNYIPSEDILLRNIKAFKQYLGQRDTVKSNLKMNIEEYGSPLGYLFDESQ